MAAEAADQGRSVLQISQQRFKDLQFGLKLIQKNTGQGEFELGVDAVEDADKFLSERVVQSYTDAAAGRQAAEVSEPSSNGLSE